jgi:glycosyltransferase involved in cell wall biosynthesis
VASQPWWLVLEIPIDRTPRDRMRILITSFTFPPQANGVAHVVAEHAGGLAKRGYHVTVATGFDPKRNFAVYPPGVQVVQFKTSGNGNLRVGYQGDIEGYQRFISSFDYDVIMCHCWQTWSTDLALRALKDHRAKKVMVSHGVSANTLVQFPRSSLHWLAWRPYVWRLGSLIRQFDHLVFLSATAEGDRFLDRDLAKKIGLTGVTVIPNGGRAGGLSRSAGRFKAANSLSDSQVVLSVGSYDKLKNQEMLLRAFYQVANEPWVLVLIGNEFGSYTQKLRAIELSLQRKRGGTKPRVVFKEKVERGDISDAYLSAEIFVNSSKTECQPLTILDSMAAGVPFISTRVGCVGELPGGVTVTSQREMAASLEHMMNEPELRAKLGRDGKNAADKTYNWERILDQYEILLQRVTSTNSHLES